MKGRFYKPDFAHAFSEKNLGPMTKPWKEKEAQPIVYFWRSSIPDSLKKIKGEQQFQHVSETNRNKNTNEFIRNSVKSINDIGSHYSNSPSASASRNQSRVNSPYYNEFTASSDPPLSPTALLTPTEINRESSHVSIHSPSRLNLNDKFELKTIKKIKHNKKFINFQIEIPENCIEKNKIYFPKVLSSKRRVTKPEVKFRNKNVNEFIGRFNKKNTLHSVPAIRSGANGWKLKQIKKFGPPKDMD